MIRLYSLTRINVLDLRSHIVACAFGTQFVFGLTAVINALGLSFFYYVPRAVQLTIIDPQIDLIVWAACVVCLSVVSTWSWKGKPKWIIQAILAACAIALVIALVFFNDQDGYVLGKTIVYLLFVVAAGQFGALALGSEEVFGQSTKIFISRISCYFIAYFFAIEVSSGVHYIARSFDQATVIGKADAGIELQLSYASYSLLPWLYLTFLFSWIWAPLFSRLLRKNSILQSSNSIASNTAMPPQTNLRGLFSVLYDYRFFLALAFAAFVGYYPYFQNPPWLVGTDAYWRYYDPLLRMNEGGVIGGFTQALGERHPFCLALLYMAQLMSHTTPFNMVRLAPVFLVVALGLSTWWFTATKKPMEFGLVVFALSVMSVTTAVGIYSSILANWMALVLWIVFFAYTAFRDEGGLRLLDFIPLLAISTLILFIHPWTWGVFAASILLVAIAYLFHEKRNGLGTATFLVSILAIDTLLAFLSLTLIQGSQGWRISEMLIAYTTVLRDPRSPLVFWDALTRLTQIWAPFFSPLSLAVSILGSFSLCRGTSPMRRRLIMAWICASAIGSILAAPLGYDVKEPLRGESQIWRLFFLTPFQLTVPFGIYLITEFPKKLSVRYGFQKSGQSIYTLSFAGLIVVGVLIGWLPVFTRPILFLVVLPAITGLAISKTNEMKLLSNIVLATFLFIVFNQSTRALSQLLIDPHNYTPLQ